MIYTLPFIAALIGWITNWIAVKMLFHPRLEKKFLFIKIQGVFPKRQKVLAIKLGDIVSKELFSIEDVKQKLKEKADSEEVKELLRKHIDRFLNERLVQALPMVAMFLNDQLKDKIREAILSEVYEIMKIVIEEMSHQLEEVVDVHEIVRQKVESFSSDKLEDILYSIMKKEFHFIEIIGGVLGFMIGCVQILILQVF